MSRFYGTLNAGRSTATKCGHATNGLTACARGWDVGAEIWIHPDRTDPDTDAVVIEATAGSNGAGRRLHLATLSRDGAGYKFTGGLVSDLLAALKQALSALEVAATFRTGIVSDDVIDDCCAAIAKARGE